MKKSADIIPFPIDPNLLFIRESARQLLRRNGEMANRYWRTECRRVRARLQSQEHTEGEISAELDRLTHAVQMELQKFTRLASRKRA
ncbi:DUF6074 family protein [Brucella pituitosa]|uniref:DUF6074 family protein n=1 Tax=Brucella pituitosa TaxID=571256 RepID=UPI003C71B3C4